MDNHLVSIVIPAYNGQRYIKNAIESVLAQSYRHIEIIVCDDASTDETGNIVKSIKDKRIRYVYFEQNAGLPENLNRGIKISQGQFICWFNQDDIFLPNKIDVQLKAFSEDSSIGAVFCRKIDIDENGREISIQNPSHNTINNRQEALLYLFYACGFLSAPTVMLRRSIFDHIGYFDAAYQIAFDLDMWFRILKKFSIKNLETKLYKYRHHSGNLSEMEKNQKICHTESIQIFKKWIKEFSIDDIYVHLKETTKNDFDKVCQYSYACLKMAEDILLQEQKTSFTNHIALGFVEKALEINANLLPACELACFISKHLDDENSIRYFNKLSKSTLNNLNKAYASLDDSIKKNDDCRQKIILEHIVSYNPNNHIIFKNIKNLYLANGFPEKAEQFARIEKGLSGQKPKV